MNDEEDRGGTAPLDPRAARRPLLIAGAALAAVAVLAALDLLGDLRAGTTALHVVVEGSIAVIGAAGAGVMARRVWRLGRRIHAAEAAVVGLTRDVAAAQADAARWRAEASELVRGLADAIDRQLAAWQLTPSEAEVARLLLKGLSHKEIAGVRDASEATVRQQATSLYRKAGLAGRAELAAFFLEDLLGPR
ncbi:MAG: helix-turn-helix transcriptional regulator [Myxococcales bacterium]|nr:helix-turn-helix transcriptional regulator [Myxococcales bacterium]